MTFHQGTYLDKVFEVLSLVVRIGWYDLLPEFWGSHLQFKMVTFLSLYTCITRSAHFEASKKDSGYILGSHGKMMENNPELFRTFSGRSMRDEIRSFYTDPNIQNRIIYTCLYTQYVSAVYIYTHPSFHPS